MKKDIHPDNYRLVVFKDMTNDYSFICPSCATSSETISWEDGNEYPLVKLDISHKSHPFFTGIVQFVDTAGRIDKFKNRYGRHMKWFHLKYVKPLDFQGAFFLSSMSDFLTDLIIIFESWNSLLLSFYSESFALVESTRHLLRVLKKVLKHWISSITLRQRLFF